MPIPVRYRVPVRSKITRATGPVVSHIKPQNSTPLSVEDLFKLINQIGLSVTEVRQLHDSLSKKHEDINKNLSNIKQGPVGRVGPPGPPGVGRPGKDAQFLDEQKLINSVFKKIRVPKDGEDGVDGIHADPGTVVELIKKRGLLSAEHITIGGTSLDAHLRTMDENARRAGVRGGGDTVAAGTGIILTRNNNGTVTISSASAPGTPVYDENVALEGSGTTYTLAHTPIAGTLRLYRGGSRQSIAEGDFTLVGKVVTLNTSLSTNETLVADYEY